MTSHLQALPNYTVGYDFDDSDRDQLLAEVDLKWLFSGQGRWIDTGQLHGDPQYAALVLKAAIESPIQSLHSCAVAMRGLGNRGTASGYG
jgi:hypothetical protein